MRGNCRVVATTIYQGPKQETAFMMWLRGLAAGGVSLNVLVLLMAHTLP